MLIGALAAVLLAGFALGLVSFKVKNRWCPACGSTTRELARRQSSRVTDCRVTLACPQQCSHQRVTRSPTDGPQASAEPA